MRINEIILESHSAEPVSSMTNKELAAYLRCSEEEVAKDREAAEEAANERSQDLAEE